MVANLGGGDYYDRSRVCHNTNARHGKEYAIV